MGVQIWWKGYVAQPYFKPRRHWTSRSCHGVVDYVQANYQWLILVALGIAGLVVGGLALR